MRRILIALQKLQTYFKSPKEYGEELFTLFLILLLSIVVLYLLIAIIRYLVWGKSTLPGETLLSRMSSRRKRILIWISGIFLFLTLLFSGLSYTSTPSFCSSCHKMQPYVKSWKNSIHKKISCLSCHQQPGILGFMRRRVEGLRNLSLASIYWQRHRPTLSNITSDESCFSCHPEISRTITKKGLRISHKEFLGKGFKCSLCHQKIGHFTRRKGFSSPKEECLFCHDGIIASEKCSFCHIRNTAKYLNFEAYSKIDMGAAGERFCRPCHAPVKCEGCHPQTAKEAR